MKDLTYSESVEVRVAFGTRREWLIDSIISQIKAGNLSDEYGAGFWAKRLRACNDAEISVAGGKE